MNADSLVSGLQSCIHSVELQVLDGDADLLRQGAVGDIIVVFNPEPEAHRFRGSVMKFLESALEIGVEVIVYSLDGQSSCPEPLQQFSPRSVPDMMATYRFDKTQYHDAGRVIGWRLRTQLHPTYDREDLTFFICYAHADGYVGREIDRALSSLHQRVARDYSEDADEPTTEHVRALIDGSDVVVLVDTPAAAASEWVTSELCVALGTGIPIVWARFGHRGGRRLPVPPADRPDVEYLTLPDPDEDLTPIAREIMGAAYECAHSRVRRVENCLHRFASRGAEVEPIDTRQRAFELRHPRPNRRYERPIRDVVQLFGRRPTPDDGERFTQLLEELNYDPIGSSPKFDLAAMVTPGTGSSPIGDGAPIVMHTSEYVAARSEPALRDEVSPEARPELLLFASFASTRGMGQPIRDAVQEIASCWLSRGGRIRFGGHPTVTPTVDYVATAVVPGEERERVTIYQSRRFVTPALLLEYAAKARLQETPSTGDDPADRVRSLTLMREAMIHDDAAAAVVIGGLTRDDMPPERSGEVPGVEEEMILARHRGVPVFLLGHTGGQAAVLASSARNASPPWSTLGNDLSEDENDDLARTDDYWGAAEIIWDATQGRTET